MNETAGEHSLVVADYDNKLLVFRGTRSAVEHPLVDMPVAICAFYMDETSSRIPAVGVASGPNVFIYRNLRPLRKFTAPPVKLEAAELELWTRLKAGEITAREARDAFRAAHEGGKKLSSRSLALLPMGDADLAAHVARAVEEPLVCETTITCMTTLASSVEEAGSLSGLVIGTESRLLILMDPTATVKLCEVELPAVPTMVVASGSFDVDWRVVCACRDARLYTVSMGEARGTAMIRKPHIELETQIVGLARVGKSVIVATSDAQVHAYLARGRKQYSMRMPAPVTNLEVLTIRKASEVKLILVALSNGEIRAYRDKELVDVLRVNDVVAAVCCGSYGREDNTLIIVTRSGAVLIKMLPRSADFCAEDKNNRNLKAGPPPEQDVPLDIPKKSKLYLEQTEREKGDAPAIHRRFQHGALKLKVHAAQAYLALAQSGEMATPAPACDLANTSGGGAVVHLAASVNGLGPFFHVVLDLRAEADSLLRHLPVVVLFNPQLYRMARAMTLIPALIPGVTVNVIFEVECIDENVQAEPLTILVLSGDPADQTPLVCSTLTMPQSELLDDQPN